MRKYVQRCVGKLTHLSGSAGRRVQKQLDVAVLCRWEENKASFTLKTQVCSQWLRFHYSFWLNKSNIFTILDSVGLYWTQRVTETR